MMGNHLIQSDGTIIFIGFYSGQSKPKNVFVLGNGESRDGYDSKTI